MNKRCIYIKSDTKQCGAYAVQNSQYCINHEDSMKDIKQLAVAKGGASESYQALDLNLPPLTINSSADIVSATVQIINELRTGQLPPKIANTVGYLLGIAIKAFEVSEIDKKLETIDRIILEKRRQRG